MYKSLIMAALPIFIVQFLLLLVQNTAVSASLENNTLNIGEWCPSNLWCGYNARCINNICSCELGYIFVPNISDPKKCGKLTCVASSSCQQYFNNTKCDSKNTCSCEESYFLNDKTQTCVKTIIGSQCSSNYSCGPTENNVICRENTCRCRMGYTSTSDQMKCKYTKCTQNSECAEWDAECSSSGQCTCKPNYKVDYNSQKCVKTSPSIGEQCISSYQCGVNALCSQQTCQCLMSYTPASNNIDCNKVVCKTDGDCSKWEGSKCDLWGDCECEPNFELDYATQKCVSTKVSVGESCTLSSQCGNFARCLQSTCRCLMGFNATVNGVNCAKVQCRKDSECEPQFGNSECNDRECACKLGTSIDETTQKCNYKSDINKYCSNTQSCGYNAYCDNLSRCKCLFGYTTIFNSKTDCQKLYCTSDYQCSNLFPNSYCDRSYVSSSCACKPFYNLENNICKKKIDDGDVGLGAVVITLLSLLPFIVCGSCIGICCYCCCCRQSRQAQVQPQVQPLPRQVIVIENPMRQRNIHFSAASAQQTVPNNQLYPELPPERPPPYNPEYQEPPQRKY